MATDMQARQLIKQVPQVVAALEFVGTDTITINPVLSGSGWEVIDDGSKLHLVWRGYIDLAGYTREELTFFTQAVDVQHGSLDTAGPTVLNSCHKDLITTRRIRDDEISLYTGTLSFTNTLDIQEIVYGEWTNFVPYATTYPSLRPTTGGTFGTGNPSAADRLHITRILSTEGSGSESVIFAGTNYLIGGVTGQEKDLVYIERLRRAYTQDPGRNV
jgi:hypothetical protein